jgi:signal transduction histidine kinase
LENNKGVPTEVVAFQPTLELVIFRLVQECLTNIHRHSGSKTALIRVVREADKIHVEVQDHGRGMSPERFAEVRSQGTGVGIRGMRERVRQVQGELTIESNALGTKIFAIFPAKTASAKGPGEIQQLGAA